MQKAIQLPSPISSPRQTPPPAAASSTSVPVPGSKSPQNQQHSPLQNTISAAAAHSPASSNATTAIATPPKKKGPPSPLSLGGAQSPPSPSFSSVAAGHSPKPTSPLLKPQQFASPKGPGSGNNVNSNRTMTGVGLPQIAAATVVSTSAGVFVGQGMSRPGKLADITGPVDTYEQMGFPFLLPHSTNHIMGGMSVFSTAGTPYHPVANNTNNNLLTFASNNNFGPVPQTYGGLLSNVKGIGIGSGINTVAGSGNPVVASVSSRRNYRVASTSANSLKASPSPTSPTPSPSAAAGSTVFGGGGFGQVSNSTNGGDLISTASLSRILEGTVRSETVTSKGMIVCGFTIHVSWAGINSMYMG